MHILIFALLAACAEVSVSTPHTFDLRGTHLQEPCNVHENVLRNYHTDLYDFALAFYKGVAAKSAIYHFVYSPLSVWLTLAGMAEGADSYTRQQIFSLLNIPYDECTRQKYYQLATSSIFQANDVKVINNRVLLLDAGVTPNPTWYDVVTKNNLLDVLSAPIRYNPEVTGNEIRRLTRAELPNLDFSGNSVILETIDYNALWTTEFADARIERSPFYDQVGNPVGFVDLMKVTKRARLGYVKSLKAKVLELPVGANERYRMALGMFPEASNVRTAFSIVTSEIITELFESYKESHVPVELAIPRFVMSSELDVKSIAEVMGITSLWTDPAATRYLFFSFLLYKLSNFRMNLVFLIFVFIMYSRTGNTGKIIISIPSYLQQNIRRLVSASRVNFRD